MESWGNMGRKCDKEGRKTKNMGNTGRLGNSRLCGIDSRNLFLTVMEPGRSKIKVLAHLLPGESPLPGLQMAAFTLCPHMIERELWCLFLFL